MYDELACKYALAAEPPAIVLANAYAELAYTPAETAFWSAVLAAMKAEFAVFDTLFA
jgi:hypothetical protein